MKRQALMQQFVEHYDPACYVVDNTGPDAVIDFFRSSGGCGRWAKEGAWFCEVPKFSWAHL